MCSSFWAFARLEEVPQETPPAAGVALVVNSARRSAS